MRRYYSQAVKHQINLMMLVVMIFIPVSTVMASSEDTDIIVSMSSLQSKLKQEIDFSTEEYDSTDPFARYLKSKTFRDLLTTDNELLWNGMVSQSKYPYVAISGIACLHFGKRRSEMESVFDLYFRLHEPRSDLIHPLLESVGNHSWSEKDFQTMNQLLSRGNVDQGRYFLLLNRFSRKFLCDWFESEKLGNTNPTLLAPLVELICVDFDQNNKAYTLKMNQALNDLVTIPGLCRVISLMYLKRTDSRYYLYLKNVIESQDIEEPYLMTLVAKRPDEIKKIMAVEKLDITKKRRVILERIVSKKTNNKS